MALIRLRRSCAIAAVLMAVLPGRAPAQQRILFPTQVTQPADVGPPAGAAPTLSPQPVGPGWDAYADPGLSPPGTTYPGATPAPYLPPGAVVQPGPYATQPYGAPDPYYTPAAPTAPGYLYPDSGPTYSGPGWPMGNPLETINGWARFMQEFRLGETYIYDTRHRGVALNDIETSATFRVPTSFTKMPFLITPGFGLQLWDGPVSTGPGSADLPARTYSAYIDTAWDPQFSPWFGAELGFRIGVYTDFSVFNTHSIREMGRGLAVINYSPSMQVKVGVVYLDRNRIKLLPAGGVFWTPDPDTRWEIFFPRPKYTHRITTTGAYQVWWYMLGEYGGGAWTIRRQNSNSDNFDYNDIRTSVGLEWVPESSNSALRGYLEVGGAFDRELVYRSASPPGDLELKNTFFFAGGIAY